MSYKRHLELPALFGTALLLAASPVAAQESETIIASIHAGGSGCPDGTWNADVSEDGRTFTIDFEDYQASVEPGVFMSSEACRLSISFEDPEGKRYAVKQVYYQGQVYLTNGVRAELRTHYYFEGSPNDGNDLKTELVGDVDMPFTFLDELTDKLTWSTCGARDLNVATNINVYNTPSDQSGFGWMTMNAATGSAQLQITIDVTDCGTGA